ncbi:MAG: hypothetical protein HYR96_13930 [Deltaproteobacteria bacterium]|nr:hypothetical protein [Deltaproteobacteria bacterium]MBI3293893.1 hypothetical protein [Deltaproteobacteria bacterium]
MKPFVASGKKGGEAKIALSVMKGFHIQANPASMPNLISTTLILENPDGISFGTVKYPAGKAYRLEGAANAISTYDGTVELRVPFEVNPSAATGALTANGKLRFQACNDKTCFFPGTIPVTLPIEVR